MATRIVLVLALLSLPAHGLVVCPSACECSVRAQGVHADCSWRGLVSPPVLDDGVVSVDLRGNALSDPSGLRAPWLQSLNLDGNGVDRLERDAFGGVPRLHNLSLRDNGLGRVSSQALSWLPFLQRLDVSGNAKSDGLLQAVSVLPLLDELLLERLNTSGLTALPASLSSLARLRRLSLSGTRMTTLTRRHLAPLAQLQELSELDVSWCHLDTLAPDVLDLVPRLLQLDVSGNAALSPPALWTQLTALRSLRKLSVRAMGWRHVSEAVLQLTSLDSLDLSDNELLAVPDLLSALPRLQQLWLRGNRLQSLPLHDNPDAALLLLDVSANQLTSVRAVGSLAALPRLQHLDLSGNHIQAVDDELSPATALHELSLAGNGLARIQHDALHSLPRLSSLDLSRNPLERVPSLQDKEQLSRLLLDSLALTALPDLSVLSRLRHLSARDNRLLDVDLSSPASLEELLLDHNGLTQLSLRLPRLRRLSARGNSLRTLHCASSALQDVDVSENELVQLSPFNASLQRLSLAHNRLEWLPRLSVSQLDLADNPLQCGCRLLWLQHWLVEHASSPDWPCQDRRGQSQSTRTSPLSGCANDVASTEASPSPPLRSGQASLVLSALLGVSAVVGGVGVACLLWRFVGRPSQQSGQYSRVEDDQ